MSGPIAVDDRTEWLEADGQGGFASGTTLGVRTRRYHALLLAATTPPTTAHFLIGSLPAATGRKMRFTGTTILKIKDGKILEEIGLDDGVTALTQLGILRAA